VGVSSSRRWQEESTTAFPPLAMHQHTPPHATHGGGHHQPLTVSGEDEGDKRVDGQATGDNLMA